MQLQQLWLAKRDWDERLEGEELNTYNENVKRLNQATAIKVKRNFAIPSHCEQSVRTELHVFCDASLRGYGCVAYARTVYSPTRIEVTLIIAKGRVVPLKGDWSIHRLELLGAIIAVRIAKKVRQASNRAFDSVTYWCDNACVLAWIRDKPERWKTFVANRIREIQASSDAKQWRYIRTTQNPSDLLSRASALDSDQLKRFWLEGPDFLRSVDGPEKHSLDPEDIEFDVTNERKAQCVITDAVSVATPEPIISKQLSSWPKTVRIVAYAKRWRTYERRRTTRSVMKAKNKEISSEEYMVAEREILRDIQRRHFAVEIASNLKDIPKRSPIYQYNPVMGETDLSVVKHDSATLTSYHRRQRNRSFFRAKNSWSTYISAGCRRRSVYTPLMGGETAQSVSFCLGGASDAVVDNRTPVIPLPRR